MNHSEKKKSSTCLGIGLMAFLAAFLLLLPTRAEASAPCENHYFVVTFSTDPTCTESGYIQSYCPTCYMENAEEVPALGHLWSDWVENMAATCTENGQEYRHCSRCNSTEYEPLYAFGHIWTPWETITDETCSTDGLEFRYCKSCVQEQYRDIPAFGHIWTPWETITAATCTTGGVELSFCKSCVTENYRDTPALGHSWNYTTLRQATCSKRGEEKRTCSRCSYSETYATNYGSHTYGSWSADKTPTAFSTGSKARKCSLCGSPDKNEVYPDGILSQGSYGNSVKDLQELLNKAGFDCGIVDGSYGKKTAAAVSAFEKTLALPEDGTAWPGIQDLLQSSLSLKLLSSTDTLSATAGSQVVLEFELTNTGNRILLLHPHSGISAEADSEADIWANTSAGWLNPQQSIRYTLTVPATDADAASGTLSRLIRFSAVPLNSLNVNIHQKYSPDLKQEEITEEALRQFEQEPKHLVWANAVDVKIPVSGAA